MTINLMPYLLKGVNTILTREGFDRTGHGFAGGLNEHTPLRPTQREGLEAYREFLGDPDHTDADKRAGYFEIPTGVGKTGMFVALINEVHKEAKKERKKVKTIVVVPTITLLTQTRDEFLEFAPDMVDQLGLYGDTHKNLSKPITIMTYDAWIALTESGELSHHNVDLLLTDEAHRGTSDRRVDLLFDKYGDGTVQLAFTATAHFDTQKSVQKTHKNEIFYKSLPQAVRDGELAEYIHSQLYIIRVEPPKKLESSKRLSRAIHFGGRTLSGMPGPNALLVSMLKVAIE